MKTLDTLKGNSAVLVMHERALNILRDIGFLDFLQDMGRPQILNMGSDVQVLATQAARSVGYYDCLSDLMNFREKYYETESDRKTKVPMDFGGLSDAIQKGYITKEEADEFRTQSTK